MAVQQLYTKCLAEAAYYIESDGEAAIIDPLRESAPYIELAKKNGVKIKYVFETHFHADFVSGHVDLAKKTGATIVYGPMAETDYDIHNAKDNEEFSIGKLKIRVLHTPGHTLESSTFLLLDENGKETAIFTGDTLLLGDVGRPDLAIKGNLTQEMLAGMLFDSLRNKIMILPDDITVYPGHGAGSSCGKNMSSDTIDTLGNQKKTNYALRADMTKAEFVKELTTGILPPPQYFPKNAMLNKTGMNSFDDVLKKGTKALDANEVEKAIANGALVLDVRNHLEFIKGFIPSSLYIGLNGTFAMWVGTLIEDIHREIVLVVPEGLEEEAVTRLARVGYDHCIGYMKGGVEAWKSAGKKIATITSVSAQEVESKMDSINLVDVRKPGEYDSEHLNDVTFSPLDFMNKSCELDKNKEYYIHCAGGYRSVIAISLLMQKGYTKLIDVAGGYDALKNTSLPRTAVACTLGN
ncbi:MAG: rhodanese-like domain-containing protein [Crocinitomicaceae bacterium]